MPFFSFTTTTRRDECAAAFAAWQGFDSPLRPGRVRSSCLSGGHGLWWQVEAASHSRRRSPSSRGSWPRRTKPIQIREVDIP